MATIRTCDKCGTGKHDKSVQEIAVRLPGGHLIDCADLCGRHRVELSRWFRDCPSGASATLKESTKGGQR